MMLEGRMEEVKTIIMIEGHSFPSIFPPYKSRDMPPLQFLCDPRSRLVSRFILGLKLKDDRAGGLVRRRARD